MKKHYSFRIEESDYAEATKVFNALGISTASGIGLYLAYVAREKQIPFAVSLQTENERIQKAIASCPLIGKLTSNQNEVREKEETMP